MPRLVCTVRDCGLPLEPVNRTLACRSRHAFDRSRSGVWNLLQPQDRRSARAGDAPQALEARARWLERGFADGLVEVLAAAAGLDHLEPGATVLDVGCGEGWFCERLFASRDLDLCGIDLSTAALRRSARRLPRATWVAANADRGLPLASASVDLALSIFGRRPTAELARVVRPGGRLLVAVPGADDLAEIREAALGRAVPRDRARPAAASLEVAGFDLEAGQVWRHRAAHDRAAIDDALAMTYRGARRSARLRLAALDLPVAGLDVTLAVDVTAFVRRGTAGGDRRPPQPGS